MENFWRMVVVAFGLLAMVGCRTTRSSDTVRTALVPGEIDLAVASRTEPVGNSAQEENDGTPSIGKNGPGNPAIPTIAALAADPLEWLVAEPSQMDSPALDLTPMSPSEAGQSGWTYSVESNSVAPNSTYKRQIAVPQPDCLVPLPQPIIDSPQ